MLLQNERHGFQTEDGLQMIPNGLIYVPDKCEDCGATFQRAQYDTNTHRCQACEQIYQLRRIADVLEYWVGMQ